MKVLITLFFMFNCFMFAYPTKQITFVVGLGEGGSADRMARTMATLLEEELQIKINVINKKENDSLDAANYVLNQPHDGYTIFTSTFSPYLPNTILSGKAKYSLNDFDLINLQWFDYDLFSVSKTSKFTNILEVLKEIKNNPKSISAAVIHNSSSHLIIKLLLEKFNIPQENLNLKFYSGGKVARNALFKSEVDLLVIAAQGSEKYRELIKPLCIVSSKRSKRWDAPTLNEAIKDTGVELPIINGPIRGFAVPKKFKIDYPNRYDFLMNVMKRTLAKRKSQKILRQKNIGFIWTGSELSKRTLEDAYDFFKKYHYLLND